ncbi:MAG TPA: hypothetical protein VIZ00_04455 [Streptosporangiaceae bacterium]
MSTTQAAADMTTGSATSADGTAIGYLRVGTGPAVVLLHGGNESARSHTQLALAPTVRYDGLQLAETAGTLATFADVSAEVLLLGGEMKRPGFIRPAFHALGRTLPRSRPAVSAGLDHGGSSDPGLSNRAGRPAAVAPEIRAFFAER